MESSRMTEWGTEASANSSSARPWETSIPNAPAEGKGVPSSSSGFSPWDAPQTNQTRMTPLVTDETPSSSTMPSTSQRQVSSSLSLLPEAWGGMKNSTRMTPWGTEEGTEEAPASSSRLAGFGATQGNSLISMANPQSSPWDSTMNSTRMTARGSKEEDAKPSSSFRTSPIVSPKSASKWDAPNASYRDPYGPGSPWNINSSRQSTGYDEFASTDPFQSDEHLRSANAREQRRVAKEQHDRELLLGLGGKWVGGAAKGAIPGIVTANPPLAIAGGLLGGNGAVAGHLIDKAFKASTNDSRQLDWPERLARGSIKGFVKYSHGIPKAKILKD